MLALMYLVHCTSIEDLITKNCILNFTNFIICLSMSILISFIKYIKYYNIIYLK